jgi:hypothetical protein
MPVRYFNGAVRRGKVGLRPLVVLLLLLPLIIIMSAPHPSYASGGVWVCNEAALEAALQGGGQVVFRCSGTITVTRTKMITQDTTLDATGQHVILSGKGISQVFTVKPGVDLRLLNLSVEADNGGLGGVTTLPSTGYPPPPAPPSEWLFVGGGGMALVIVSIAMGLFMHPRRR